MAPRYKTEIEEGIRRLSTAIHRLAAQSDRHGTQHRGEGALTPIV